MEDNTIESHVSVAVGGDIDKQITTAQASPRDIEKFFKKVERYATVTDDIAASCFYKLKRKSQDGGSNFIEGPSIRFAELVATTYGNLRVDGGPLRDDSEFTYSEGIAWDLETNVAFRVVSRRRITTSNGMRYGVDMVGVTSNAATSIAIRNAIFRIVPRALWEPIMDTIKKTAVGTTATFAERRQKMLEYYTAKLGVPSEKIWQYLEISGIESMTLSHLETLRGVATSIKDGETTVEKEFLDKDDGDKLAMPRGKEPGKKSDVPASLAGNLQRDGSEQVASGSVDVPSSERGNEDQSGLFKDVPSPDGGNAIPASEAGIAKVVETQAATVSPIQSIIDQIDGANKDSWATVREMSLGLVKSMKTNGEKLEITRAINRRQAELK